MANVVYSRGQYALGQGRLTTSANLQVMLVTTAYVANMDHNTVDDGTTSDPASYEISVSGYARQQLASLTLTEDDTNDCAYFDAADTTFQTLAAGQTVGGAVVYIYSSSGGTTSDTGQDLATFLSLTPTPCNGGNITIVYSTAGIIRIGTTS
ncbi:MAG: hypothetical protein ACM3NQ_04275 [Bacteroidales bacterium]